MPSDKKGSVIPLSAPDLSGNEADYLAECISTNWVSTAGPFVSRFEQMVAEYVGAPHSVATATGTAAIHLALIVAGVRPGDEVLVSTLSFIAPANAIRYVGAFPVFVDADPNDWQMDAALAVDYLKNGCEKRADGVFSTETGRRIGAVLPVHILGSAVNLSQLLDVARDLGVPVVEDATEGLGARYEGRFLGTLGDVGCFSFNGNKLATCGGGGMIVTPNPQWAERAAHLSTQAKVDSVESIHDEIGFNYRLTNLQAAVGCAQMERIDQFIAARRKVAAQYAEFCKSVDFLDFMPIPANVEPVNWLSAVLVKRGGRAKLGEKLMGEGIETRPLWQPLHKSPAHPDSLTLEGEAAEKIQESALCLPSSSALLESEILRVIKALDLCVGEAKGADVTK